MFRLQTSLLTLALVLGHLPALAAGPDAFHFGVAYYPEQWPAERLETDLRMMEEAGINCVRLGELSWSMIEPREGEVSFAYFDHIIRKLSDHGIKTLFGTSSRTPPPWVFATYPEILNVEKDGRANNFGHRYTVNLLHPKFIELSRRIDGAIIRHYARNENVVGWQIDNEIGSLNIDYSDHTRALFHEYLRQKYATAEQLNRRWGAHFWSFVISDFAEVPLPTIEHDWGVENHPGLSLDWARFNSRVHSSFAAWRYELMKREAPEKWVTTNFQHSRAAHTDIFELGEATDIYGINFYPPGAHEFGLDLCRGGRRELLVLEQRSGQPMWDSHTEPGMMRLWAWNSIAHGANGIFFYRWRPTTAGQEQYWHGIVPHSGNPNRRYRELQKMGGEIARSGDLILDTAPDSEVAILMGYDSWWALDAVLMKPELSVQQAVYRWHEALMANHVTTDALDPREDLSRYKLVIAPRLYLTDPAIEENLREYVRKGGNLVLTFRSGVVDEYNKIHPMPAPGPLSDLAGVEVDDYGALDEGNFLALNTADLDPVEAVQWADEIKPTTAEVIATYTEDWLDGLPAITRNRYGKGNVYYVGTAIPRPHLDDLTGWLLDQARVPLHPEIPDGIRFLKRRGNDYSLLFYLNFSDSAKRVQVDGNLENILTGTRSTVIEIAPKDVVVLKEPS